MKDWKSVVLVLLVAGYPGSCGGGSVLVTGDAGQGNESDLAGDPDMADTDLVPGEPPGPEDDSSLEDVPDDAGIAGTDDPDEEEEIDCEGYTGDSCHSSDECGCVPGAGRECLTNLSGYVTFPGGYCSAACTSDSECGEGARCVAITTGHQMCLKLCRSTSQCRMAEGYTCEPIPMSADTNTYCLAYNWYVDG